jgi:hypothetical protein
MTHGRGSEGETSEWSTLHTTLEHGVSSITTADAHTSGASGRLNWRHARFQWTRPFRWKTKSCFCACAITFQKQSTPNRHYAGKIPSGILWIKGYMDARAVLCVTVKRKIGGGLILQKRRAYFFSQNVGSSANVSANSTLRMFVSFHREFKNTIPIVSYSYFIQLLCDLSRHTL